MNPPPAFADPIRSRAERRIGSTLCGRYRIGRLIGIGGMAAVYASRHRNGHEVAIKILHERLSMDPESERLFRREALLSNQIRSPGIVPVIDDDVSEDGCVFLVMPLLEGETLRARAASSGGKLPIVEVVSVAHHVLSTLEKAHAAKIVHRDIKPENIFLSRDGGVLVLDFGIARFFEVGESTSTRSGRAVGTPAFMSPEQALGRVNEVDGRTDVWAVGATMFALLSGKHVHQGATAGETLVLAATRPPPRLGELASNVPAPLCAVVDRALAFSRAERWPTAAAMNAALVAAYEESSGRPASSLRMPSTPLSVSVDELHSARTEVPVFFAPKGEHVEPPASNGSRPGTDYGAAWKKAVAKSTAVAAVARRKARLAVFGLAVFGVAALLFTWVIAAVTQRQDRSAGAAGPSRGTREPAPVSTDARTMPRPPAEIGLPLLPAKVPEAAREYLQGMQAWHDAADSAGSSHLLRAVELDPSFAPAHLALSYSGEIQPAENRRHLAAAVELRGRLGDRDQALLEVLAQQAGDVYDYEANAQRWTRLAERYPRDPPLALFAGQAAMDAGQSDRAFALYDRALSLDPTFASALQQRARSQLDLGALDDAVASANACLALSPSAASCIRTRARVEQRLGQCAQVEQDAHKWIELEPEGAAAYDLLAAALIARGSPHESIVEALARARERELVPNEKAFDEATNATAVAWLTGDFAAHIASFPHLHKVAATLTSDERVGRLVIDELQTLMETGQTDQALEVVDRYMKRRPALNHDDDVGALSAVLTVQRRAGRITDAEFRDKRDAWIRDAMKRLPPTRANEEWFYFYAETAISPEDAREALEALTRYSPLPPYDGVVFDERVMGRVLLLAGRADEAIPHLERAAHACFDLDSMVSHQLSVELLGEALESKGDSQGACAAYAEVLAHWGHAKPRSVTADEARARATKLGCAASRRL
ncbi:MAG: protein kinase domain-containing protein [Polyangiaceae bacterium]